MKKQFFLMALIGSFIINFSFGQKIYQNQVPSVVLNQFQQNFPNAKQIEWEKKPGYYEVEFEIGMMNRDHEIWYDSTGKVLYHKEEIAKSDLPAQVANTLKKDFKSYRIKDVKKIFRAGIVTYKMEAKSLTEEWELVIDASGKIISQKPD